MAKKVAHVVVDSAAFIKNANIEEFGENAYTVPGVISEIRDRATRERLQVLPYSLTIREPTPEAKVVVSRFSKQTGDYHALSGTDLCILALTYDLVKEYVGTEHLNAEPKCTMSQKEAALRKHIAQKHSQPPEDGTQAQTTTTAADSHEEGPEAEEEESEDLTSGTANMKACSNGDEKLMEKLKGLTVDADEDTSDAGDTAGGDVDDDAGDTAGGDVDDAGDTAGGDGDDDDDDIDDEEGWITTENFQSEAATNFGLRGIADEEPSAVPLESEIRVACLTTDFAMQNVLLQMGLHILTVEGMLVKRPRSYALWCFTCFTTTLKIGIYFCPKCGNSTLHRIPVTIREDGSLHHHFRKNYQFNLKGTKLIMPRWQGGKHARNPIVFADQRLPQQRPRKLKGNADELDDAVFGNSSPFAQHDVSSRAATLGVKSRGQPVLKPTRGGGMRRKKKK